jgi:hypothetical protein
VPKLPPTRGVHGARREVELIANLRGLDHHLTRYGDRQLLAHGRLELRLRLAHRPLVNRFEFRPARALMLDFGQLQRRGEAVLDDGGGSAG